MAIIINALQNISKINKITEYYIENLLTLLYSCTLLEK